MKKHLFTLATLSALAAATGCGGGKTPVATVPPAQETADQTAADTVADAGEAGRRAMPVRPPTGQTGTGTKPPATTTGAGAGTKPPTGTQGGATGGTTTGGTTGATTSSTNSVTITTDTQYRYIKGNGIPDHTTGTFPNANNPNTISAQSYSFRVPLKPVKTSKTTSSMGILSAVGLNSVPFDPFAAEWWNNSKSSGWQYEPLGGGINLGTDSSNAHVQPTGAYHYHGMPEGLIAKLGKGQAMTLVGWMADGFPLYARYGYNTATNASSGVKNLKSSYRIKSGTRPGGPGGTYNGTFVQDYEYVAGLGDLDDCNGRTGVTPEFPQGTYYYVLTDTYPFVPRCFKGAPDVTFRHQM